MPSQLAEPLSRDAYLERGMSYRALSVRNNSLRESDRSVESVLSTDAPVVVRDHLSWEPIEEILQAGGGEFAEHVPLLGAHRHYSEMDVYGDVREIRQEGSVYVGRNYFSEPAHERDPVAIVWKRVLGGHLRTVSIGYAPLEFTDLKPGQKATIGGRQYTAGAMTRRITTRYLVYEVSLVPIPADSGAMMRARGNQTNPTPTIWLPRFGAV